MTGLNPSEAGQEDSTIGASNSSSSNIVILPDGSKPIRMASGVITGILGEGGMAVVYEIWNEQLGIKRAVKLLRPNSSKDGRNRFNTEVKITAQLDHPNIIRIHSVGEWNGLPLIEMDRVDGFSLEEIIKRHGALPLEVCTAIAIIIARALDYTHHLEYMIDGRQCIGLLHRDLKPANILISRRGTVRLTDFGIATPSNDSSKTEGKVIGSMQYLAPEQLEDKTIDTRADIFSFGCIIYEMLTGIKAFSEKNITKLVRKRLKNEYEPLSSFNISIPLKLSNLVSQCIQLQASKRPYDIHLVKDELERIHAKLTTNSAEEVIGLYISGKNVKNMFELKKRPFSFPFISDKVAISLIAVACIIIATVFLFPNNSKNYHVSKENTKSQKSAIKQESAKKIMPTEPPTGTKGKNLSPLASNRDDAVNAQTVPGHTASKTETQIIDSLSKTALGMQKEKEDSAMAVGVRAQKVTRVPEVIEADQVINDINENKITSLIQELRKKYNTDDVVEILKKEDKAQHYDNVLIVSSFLSADVAKQREVRMLRHRALNGTNQLGKSYYEKNTITDGEFYFSKGMYLYNSGQYQKALTTFKLIQNTSTSLMNKNILEKEVLYYSAKCFTEMFLINPNQETQKNAMEAWFNVKKLFQENQTHPYFVEANKEIRYINKALLH